MPKGQQPKDKKREKDFEGDWCPICEKIWGDGDCSGCKSFQKTVENVFPKMKLNKIKKFIRGTPRGEYQRIHYWLKKNYGKATRCESCTRPNKVFNWALKNGLNYDYKRSNFMQLCRSCHAKQDCEYLSSGKKLSKLQKRLVDLNVHFFQTLRQRVGQFTKDGKLINTFNSQLEASKITGITQSNISGCVRGDGRYYSAGGFIWKRV